MTFQFTRIRMLGETGGAILTPKQREWVDTAQLIYTTKPVAKVRRPATAPVPSLASNRPFHLDLQPKLTEKQRIRHWCLRVSDSHWFDTLMLAIVTVNMGILGATHYGQPVTFTNFSNDMEYFFTLSFLVEAILKLTAYRPKLYFRNGW